MPRKEIEKPNITLEQFENMWRGKVGRLYVADHMMFDEILDCIFEDHNIKGYEIFDKIKLDPFFTIDSEYIMYTLSTWMKEEWLNARVREFFSFEDGIIVLVDDPIHAMYDFDMDE